MIPTVAAAASRGPPELGVDGDADPWYAWTRSLERTLREMDHQGPLGTMGYTQSGDIPGKLDRAHQAWEQIKQKALKP